MSTPAEKNLTSSSNDEVGRRVRAHAEKLIGLCNAESSGRALAYLRWKLDTDALRRSGVLNIRTAIEKVLDEKGTNLSVCSLLSPAQEFKFTPIAVVQQHAVGHGGFHSGALGIERPYLRWIYDCGAWRQAGKDALASAITEYAAKATLVGRTDKATKMVDLLFISHFDADHVSGLNDLLSVVTVDTVIVPYLDVPQQFSALAEAVFEGRWSPFLQEAILDPGAWFKARGVRRLIRLRAGLSPEGSGLRPDTTRPPLSIEGAPVPFEPVVILDPRLNFLPFVRYASDDETDFQVCEAEPGISVVANALGSQDWTDWAFLPYVHPVSSDAIARATSAMEALLRLPMASPNFRTRLLQYLSAPKLRGRLKKLYSDYGLGNANASSLSLYCGPFRDGILTDRQVLSSNNHGRARLCGWLLTGDAELGYRIRREAWHKFFDPFHKKVGTVMLPHHGAASNFHSAILDSLSSNIQLFATANSGDPLRPHENVRDAIRDWTFKVVTENRADLIREISGPALLAGPPSAINDFFCDWL